MSRVRPQFRRVASRLLARPVVSENFEPRSIRDPCRLCGKIRSSPPRPLPRAQSFFLSRSISLPISLIPYAFVQPRVGPPGPPSALSYPRRSLAKAIPGIHQEPQFQVPSSPWRAECCFTSSRKVLSWRESQVYCTWREREKEKEGRGDERGQGGWLARTHAYIHTDEDRVACATKHL